MSFVGSFFDVLRYYLSPRNQSRWLASPMHWCNNPREQAVSLSVDTLPGAANARTQSSATSGSGAMPAGVMTSAELQQAQRRTERLLRDLGIEPVLVGGHSR